MSSPSHPVKLNPQASLHIALASYLSSLSSRPILTKSCTSGALYLISELVSSAVAFRSLPATERAKVNAERQVKDKVDGWGRKARGLGVRSLLQVIKRYEAALKLAGYGFFIAAPLDHYLYLLLDKFMSRRPASQAKTNRVLEIVLSNALILPIQNAVYLAVLAVLGGVRSGKKVWGEVRGSMVEVMRLTVVTSTLALLCAQRFLPPSLWTPFFSLSAATVDTFINVGEKKRAIGEERVRQAKEEADRKSEGYEVDGSEK
ncbi:hypothetical protein JCM11251_003767 [Rhodosporidiobolus azoricus]